jgi:hypothetical protein
MRQIFVDSRDRVSGTSTDFSIQLPETLTLTGTRRMRIDNLRVPLVFPTIQAGKNDTLVVSTSGGTYTATIAQANYAGPQLASAVQSALASVAPGVWTVSYDPSNITMTISCSNNFTILGGTYGDQLMLHPYTQSAKSYKSTDVTVLGLDMMYLSSSRFSNLDTIGPQGAHDTLMCAIVTQEFGSVLDVSMPWDSYIDVPNGLTTQQLDFQLRDRSYNILSIVPNISFVILID